MVQHCTLEGQGPGWFCATGSHEYFLHWAGKTHVLYTKHWTSVWRIQNVLMQIRIQIQIQLLVLMRIRIGMFS